MKAICAFLVVCIHVPFPGEGGEYFTALTRIAVPIFFMITGYFYSTIVCRGKEAVQIKKVLALNIKANTIFMVWKLVYSIAKGKDVLIKFLSETFSREAIIRFLLFNDNQIGPHLWYLSAILYVLVIVQVFNRWKLKKLLFYCTPLLLLVDLIFGKYSLLLLNREVPYYYVRNFAFVGIPYFSIGHLIYEKRSRIKEIGRKWFALETVIFSATTVFERAFLISIGKNAVRDHYLSTTFLAISIFAFALLDEHKKSNSKGYVFLSLIGREYSTGIYILHPIFIAAFQVAFEVVGVFEVYKMVAPIVVYLGTVVVLYIARSNSKKSKNNAKSLMSNGLEYVSGG